MGTRDGEGVVILRRRMRGVVEWEAETLLGGMDFSMSIPSDVMGFVVVAQVAAEDFSMVVDGGGEGGFSVEGMQPDAVGFRDKREEEGKADGGDGDEAEADPPPETEQRKSVTAGGHGGGRIMNWELKIKNGSGR